ncbi:MAG: hypothetical protein S4CHLAM6_11240 [Chlamydiae bacterium]|nr:hypothetical protein [Chlamydiota bacterium]
MKKNLFIGNLPHSINDDQLRELFEAHGAVESARVIMDRMTQRSKGFGFVEMSSEAEAEAAIEALDSKEVNGRPIAVKVANPRESRGGGGNGGGRRYDGNR